MGLLKNKPIEYNLWDGLIKPVSWYFSDAGKSAFMSALENAEEMKEAIENSNWISIIFNVCYRSSKKPLAEKKNWLIKYFYEYVLSQYSVKMASNEHALILLTLMACDSKAVCRYPDCLDGEKHPLLYFFGQVNQLLPGGYSEQTYPVLKDIVHYIYNAYIADKDVSKESWMYDKTFYVDYSDKPQKYSLQFEKLKESAGFPEYLYI